MVFSRDTVGKVIRRFNSLIQKEKDIISYFSKDEISCSYSEFEEFLELFKSYKLKPACYSISRLTDKFERQKIQIIFEMYKHALKFMKLSPAEFFEKGKHENKNKIKENFKAGDDLIHYRNTWGDSEIACWNILNGIKWPKKIINIKAGQNLKVLDYGCSVGMLGSILHKQGVSDLFLTDLPGASFNFAKDYLKENAKFIEIENGCAKLPDNFDMIFCWDVLEHTPNPLEIVINLTNNLKKGGYLILSFINLPNTAGGCNLKEAQLLRPQVIDYIHNHYKTEAVWDKKEFGVLLRKY